MRKTSVMRGLLLGGALSFLLAAGPAAAAADEKPKKQQKNQNEELLMKYYKKWMEEDVYHIISEEEKAVFKKLTTDEERDQFIEQFWRRRDPDPKTPVNEYKEELYRRIAYANEHFSSGIPGWKTDRGMVYIKYGKPDHIEDYSYGSGYDRPAHEGLGQTKVFPFQIWEYRNIDGIGTDIELEFVDSGGGNLYTLTTNPWDKDLLLHASTSGKTLAEQHGLSEQIYRVVNRHDGGETMDPLFREREKDRPFAKYELLANVSKAPEIKYKDLKSVVNSRIKYDLMPFEVRVDYIKISEKQMLVPITLRISNSAISFQERKFGIARGTINFYGIVTTLSGNYVKEFEDDIVRDVKEDQLENNKNESSNYQKFLLLNSGVYKLGLVVKDLGSGRLGTTELKLDVPAFPPDRMNGSSVILSRQITKIDDPNNDLGPFVLGDLKVVPDFDKKYKLNDPLWVYLQVYNLTVDQNRLQPDVQVEYIVEHKGEEFFKFQDLTGDTYNFVSGDRLVIAGRLSLRRFPPGQYRVKVRVVDNISGNSIERFENFEITS